jgi:hypothetical protein
VGDWEQVFLAEPSLAGSSSKITMMLWAGDPEAIGVVLAIPRR